MQPQAGREQQAENIEAVLGRFQAWAKTRKKSDLGDGVRELSYEEALRSSRFRWQPYADETSVPAKTGLAKEPAVRARTDNVPATDDIPERPRPKRVVPAVPGGKKKTAVPSTGKSGARARSAREAEFREVLAAHVKAPVKQMEPEAVLARAEPVDAGRQVSLSVRFAASERALIKTRAAEAGIPVSAYLRQCALEVEQLREQVQLTLAALEREMMQARLGRDESRREASAPGFFARIKRRFFGGASGRLALRD